MYSLFNFFLIPPLPPSPHEPFSTQLGAVTAFSTCLSQSTSLLPLSAAHIWADNSVIKQLQVHSVNVISIKAELMAIHTGLIPAMEIDNIHNITIITDSMATAKKILESKVNPLQSMFIPLALVVKTFLSKDIPLQEVTFI